MRACRFVQHVECAFFLAGLAGGWPGFLHKRALSEGFTCASA